MSKENLEEEFQWPSRASRTATLPVRFDLDSERANERRRAERSLRDSEEAPNFVDEDYAFTNRRSRSRSPRYGVAKPVKSDNSDIDITIDADSGDDRYGDPTPSYRMRRSSAYSPSRYGDEDSIHVRTRYRRPGSRSLRQRRGSFDNAVLASDPDSSISDDAYSFTLTRHKRVLSGLDFTSDAVSEVSDGDVGGLDPEKAITQCVLKSTIHNIFNSKYTGEGSVGGVQSAQLTVLPIPPQGNGQKKNRPPLFKWIHFEDSSMNFDDYQNGIAAIPGLSDFERQAISRLLARVGKRFDKAFQTSSGMKAKFMVPSLISENIVSQSGSKGSRPRVVTWMCLPHFTLQKYKGGQTTARIADHPLRTLMQTRFSLAQKSRDMQQAVCHLLDTPEDYCFHIAQTWYLVLDDAMLITSAGIHMPPLQGDVIKIILEPSPKPYGYWPPFILVSSGRCLLWCFRVDECQSWFEFIVHFGQFWPRRLEFKHNGKIIKAVDWPRIVAYARKTNVRLTMEHRAPLRDKFEAPKDFIPVERDIGKTTSTLDPNVVSNDLKNRTGTNTASAVLGLAVHSHKIASRQDVPGSLPNDEGRQQNANPPIVEGIPGKTTNTQAEGYFNKSTSNPGETTKPEPTSSLLGAPKSSPKPDNTSDGFYVFTWLNSYPKTVLSPSTLGFPLERSQSRNRGSGSPSGFQDDSAALRSVPEIQWSIEEQGIIDDLKEVDEFLKSKSSVSDRVAYQDCALSSRQLIVDQLTRAKQKLMGAEKVDPEKLKILGTKETIAAAADQIFQFFLPITFEGPTIEKYWGAIYSLILPNKSDKTKLPDKPSQYYQNRPKERREKRKRNFGCYEEDVPYIVDLLGQIATQVQPFKELYTQALSTDRLNIDLPEEFPKAWLYLLIFLASITKDLSAFYIQSSVVYDLLDKGMRKVVQETSKKSLLESLVFTPFELASLINFQLLEGTNPYSQDIVEPCWQYLRGLEASIAANPVDRSHQDRIALFKQEIYVIKDTLNQQRQILTLASPSVSFRNSAANMHTNHSKQFSDYRSYPIGYTTTPRTVVDAYAYDSPAYHTRLDAGVEPLDVPVVLEHGGFSTTSQLAPTHPNGVLGILIYDAISLVDHKIRDLREMHDWLSHLQDSNLQKIDTNKDRQEAAIYAFTIVTIVFLPLTTVASIMGMNTADIRDMEFGQEVFWAAAIPLMIIIIALCLVWAGELGNFWKGFRNMWKDREEAKRREFGEAARKFVSTGAYNPTPSDREGMYNPPPPRHPSSMRKRQPPYRRRQSIRMFRSV